MILDLNVHQEGMTVLAAKLSNACKQSEHVLAVQIQKDTSPFVPMRTGSLDIRTKVEGNTIIYPGPYARYLYNGVLYVDPETGSAWAKKGATKVPTSKALNIKTSAHPQATSRWFEASKAQNLEKWVNVADKAVKYDFK